MTNPLATLYQPFAQFIPGNGITISLDTGTEDEGDNEITIAATGGGLTFTAGGVYKSPTGADDVLVWVADFACTVTGIKAWQDVSTGSVINAFKGSLASPTTLLTANFTISAADTAQNAGTVQNTAIAAGDKVYIRLVSVAGSPAEVGVQISLTRT